MIYHGIEYKAGENERRKRKESTGLSLICGLKPVTSANFLRPSHQPPQTCLWKKGVVTSVPASILIADKVSVVGKGVWGGEVSFLEPDVCVHLHVSQVDHRFSAESSSFNRHTLGAPRWVFLPVRGLS